MGTMRKGAEAEGAPLLVQAPKSTPSRHLQAPTGRYHTVLVPAWAPAVYYILLLLVSALQHLVGTE